MESLAQDLRQMRRTPLHDNHVAALRRVGTERTLTEGEVVGVPGDPMDRFTYIEDGEIEVFDLETNERHLPSTLGPRQFVGEIAFLSGGFYTMPMRAAAQTRVIEVERVKMLDLMSQIPEMSDIVITVFAARRRRQIEEADSGLRLIGADLSADIQRIASFANRNKIPFKSYDLGTAAANETARTCSIQHDGPAVVFGKNQVVDNPTPEKIAKLLGLDLKVDAEEILDVVIVGGGPAGVAAAVYAGAEGLSAVVVEDISIGGQAGTSSRIENYMGFPTGISGADLVWRGEIQAMKFGTRFAMPRRVTEVSKREDGLFFVTLDDGQALCAKAIVVATGVQYRRLPLERLEEFEGQGVFYAATEMEARACRNTDAVIIGGGNSAGQAAMFLSRHAVHTHLLVRGKSLAASMSNYLTARLEADPNITIHYQTEVDGLNGADTLETVTVKNRETGQTTDFGAAALFVMVGAAPNTKWLSGLVDLDEKGFVKTGADAGEGSPYATSHPGIFAVGDVRSGSVKRVASAVGEGSVVISKVWDYANAGQP